MRQLNSTGEEMVTTKDKITSYKGELQEVMDSNKIGQRSGEKNQKRSHQENHRGGGRGTEGKGKEIK